MQNSSDPIQQATKTSSSRTSDRVALVLTDFNTFEEPPAGQAATSLQVPSWLMLFLVILVPVLLLALVGIASRPVGSLASIWPANAFLLGVMARQPGFTRPSGWLMALLGFLLADWLTGAPWDKNLLLNLGNLLGVAGGLFSLRLLPGGVYPITQKLGIIRLLLVALFASLAASLIGMFAYPYFWSGTPLQGAVFWSVSEFVNYIAFLPVVLTAPASLAECRNNQRRFQRGAADLAYRLFPFVSFIALCVLVVMIDGPVCWRFLLWLCSGAA